MDIVHHCIECGSGFPLILLHGNGGDGGYFSNQIPEFSRMYQVFAIDTRGHGKTGRGEAPFTVRQFADDLAGFMDSRKIDAANILGFSDGANIAMVFAVQYPNRVKKLIVNGGNLNAQGIRRSVQIPIKIGYQAAGIFANKSPQARAHAEMLNLMVNEPDIPIADLAGIQAPTLVIAGTKDIVKESHTRLIAENIPHAELKFVTGGHFIANKNPMEFNQKVLDFLQS